MPAVSIETITVLLQIAFLVGAVTDGLAVIPMLSRRIGAGLFGGDAARATKEFRFAMGIGAALMAGWTLLLLWGAASPIARRDILLLTVFPVIAGIVLATVIAARRGLVSAEGRNGEEMVSWGRKEEMVSGLTLGEEMVSGLTL